MTSMPASHAFFENRILPIEDDLRQGNLQQAGRLLEALYDARPQELVALEALANILQDEGKIPEAVFLYLRLAELCPANADVFFNVGNIHRLAGRFSDAADAFRQVLSLNGKDFEAWQQLGNVLRMLGQEDDAADCFSQAIVLNPDFYQACLDLGNTLRSLGQTENAIGCYRRAVEINPGYALAHYNLGVGLMEQGSMDAAIACYRKALDIDPQLVEAKWNCALCMLANGNFTEGWKLFEARLARPAEPARQFAAPRWNGEDLAEKTILIHAEQGFGDTLQFARYIALLSKFCKPAGIVLECQPELKRLLQCIPGVARIVAGGIESLPHHDVHLPLLSLPLMFGTTPETIPSRVPYVTAQASLIEKWKRRLAAEPRKKAGLVWAGRATHPRDARRSIVPERLVPLLDMADICFVSLQAEVPGRDAPVHANLLDHTPELEDFAETAALIAQLDLVISVDTAVAHLAGAMGKRVWLLNPYESEWRWMRDRSDSPWYPSMTIFRQEQPGLWDGVLSRVAAELKRIAAS